MNVYNLTFFSLIEIYSYITNGLRLKYLMKKIYEFECLHIEKSGFFVISQKKELIEQNHGQFWIQRARLTLSLSPVKRIFLTVKSVNFH